MRKRRTLPLFSPAPHDSKEDLGGRLERHPRDGFVLADPYPMGPRTRSAFRGLIRAFCPPSPAPSSKELVDAVELTVRRLMRYMGPLAARLLLVAFVLLDWTPRLSFTSVRRIQSLPPDKAARVLARLMKIRLAPLRSLVIGIRSMIVGAYFDQAEVHRALDYAPVPFLRGRIRERKRLLEERDADRVTLEEPRPSGGSDEGR